MTSRIRNNPKFLCFRSLIPLLLFCLSWNLCAPSFAQSEEEKKYPDRIISSTPSITELLFALGAGDQVVGVSDYCSYPPEACTRPSVGGLLNPSVEFWITLKPDLIIFQGKNSHLTQNANNLNIKTLSVSVSGLQDIFNAIQILGKEIGRSNEAEALTAQLKEGLQSYQDKLSGIRPKNVLLLLGDSNDPSRDMYAVGKGTFLDELLTLSGGRNILPDSLSQYPKVSKEFIIKNSPEIIIEAGPKSRMNEQERLARIQSWKRFPTIQAVQTESIHFIGADYILIPGPRILSIIDNFSQAIHPELFPATPQSVHEKR
ncbi:MAG: ABC transporter substrate-binding protein [Candidatus Nitrohelix vancouverensis]|uniref:ABC transporter substrate-binding protein n=1 Tax=Candidatus Nitrohelix vancouverensis TaxID=2705534 RepID=A0A7T0C320_9BACT|nr:MAG: ABC transporter substrate-binding protein [Candidatus Nitrohelix vancouverensis]